MHHHISEEMDHRERLKCDDAWSDPKKKGPRCRGPFEKPFADRVYCCVPSGHWTNWPLAKVIDELKLCVAPAPSVVQVPPSLPPEQTVYSPITADT